MDAAKIEFLFGKPPAGAGTDKPGDEAALLSQLVNEFELEDDEELAVYELLAQQVLADDPTEVWETAQRLLRLGTDRGLVLSQMAMALAAHSTQRADGIPDLDLSAYLASLTALPLPNPAEASEVFVAVVRELQPVDDNDLTAIVCSRLGVQQDQHPHTELLEYSFDQLVEDEILNYVSDDRVVHPASFCSGSVLTHRMSEAEAKGGYVEFGADLCFPDTDCLEGPGGAELEESWRDGLGPVWQGAKGLEGLPVGTVVAARSDAGGDRIQVEIVDFEPAVDKDTVDAVRSAYERLSAEPGLPVLTRSLVLELLADNRQFFAVPRAPLSELAAAASLERRDDELADDPEMWRQAHRLRQVSRVIGRLGGGDHADAALEVLSLFGHGNWDDARALREALVCMKESPTVAEAVTDELFRPLPADDPEAAEDADLLEPFANRLLEVAVQPSERAVAQWLRALVAENTGDLAEATARLHMASESGVGWGPAIDRLAWYLADKGEAIEAARLWRALGVDPQERELANVESFSRVRGIKLGRNEPCWCGSGRKFKMCHLDQPVAVPLPDRVGWLAGKSVSYLKRQRARAAVDIMAVVSARVEGDISDKGMKRAFADPLTLDLVLVEGRWFERFVKERSALIPDDEALLAVSWALVDRTVYEVVSVRPGSGLTVKDLRSAEDVEVRERSFSNQAVPGMLICGRAVPDGVGHQFVGAVFPVRAGTEAELLDLLDDGDPEKIAAWVARLERPPTLQTREGEATVMCEAVLHLPAPDQAHETLARLYRPSARNGEWEEVFPLNSEENILRATLRLEGSRLRVSTHSEERMDRVLANLKEAIPELEVLSDDRRPFDWGQVRSGAGDDGAASGRAPAPGAGSEPLTAPAEVREQIQDMMERRWCDDEVPALAGLTPRQAAADPTRRESLERLLAEFERMDAVMPDAGFGMRPGRLRELLGLR
jgi:hypothetical protein